MRVIDVALPMLEAGQSLRFALLPEGQDPDDLIRSEGAGAMRKLLENALPMVQLLWRRETEGRVFDSPERKATLDKALREAVRKIKDPSIRHHYGAEINLLRQSLFGGNKTGRAPWKPWRAPETALPSTRNSALAGAGVAVEERLREAVILATCISTPEVVEEFVSALEDLDLRASEYQAMRQIILAEAASGMLREKITGNLGADALENLFSQRHVAISPPVRNPGNIEVARASLAEDLAKLEARRGAAREIEEAAADLEGIADEGLTWRLSEAAKARDKAERAEREDKTVYDTAPSGAKLNREERSALDTLLGQINYTKGGRRAD
jgi:DNA primase